MRLALANTESALTETQLFARIASNAADADAGRRDLAPDMALLSASGELSRLCHPDIGPKEAVTLLRRIGRANLSVGRLTEGHMNAVRLITLYGSPDQRRLCKAEAAAGAIFGVWGADGPTPVRVVGAVGERFRLAGSKRFASGLGVVSRAVVTAGTPKGTQLVFAHVDENARADESGWDTSGMRATASGTYDFEGVQAIGIGKPGDYEREPHFQGGVWRYAALHVGGLEALAEAVRKGVASFGDSAGEAQLHRVARIASLAHGARLIIEDAAAQVEAAGADHVAVALSLAAREAVEDACLNGMAIADRALGTRSFSTGQAVERIRRDLSFFLRQADLDGKLQQVARTLCRMDTPVGEFWDAT
ncbi:MAG: hypothetical protein KDJ90_01710 [Nitratireductor sp.]|nr:hypothetical protein [Nitratireductor sp.]